MIENRKYYIDQINSSKANKFTSYYHYSKTGFKKAKLNLGLFRKSDNLLVGVLQWGVSFQEKIRLDRYVKEDISKEEYLELNRFCMADSEERNSESQAISLGIKWIKRNWPQIKLLVSYAGRKEGNYGFIYQATNWDYLGYFISPGFWQIDGREKHLMTVWCNYQKACQNKLYQNMNEYLCDNFNNVAQTWTKQFIYIQRLDKTLTPASPILPYPKATTDGPIKTREKILKSTDILLEDQNESTSDCPIYYYEKEKYLFSRAALRRRGELPQGSAFKYAQYNHNGELEQIYSSSKESAKNGFNMTYIKKAIAANKFYKDKFFVQYNYKDEIEKEVEVPYICMIDEITFPTYVAAAAYLGVSKQAVQQAHVRLAKRIGGKDVIWEE